MKKIGFAIVWMGLLAACGNKVPRDVLPPEKMKLVMWDLLRADELAAETVGFSNFGRQRDSMCEVLYQKVFLMHKTDKESFARSLRFYQGNPNISKQMLDSVISIGERERKWLNDSVILKARDSLTAADTAVKPLDTTKLKPFADSAQVRDIKTDSTVSDSLRRRAKMLRDSLLLRRHKLNTKATK